MKNVRGYTHYGIYLMLLLIGILLGYLIFDSPKTVSEASVQSDADSEVRFTCSMHPSVLVDQQGSCPICGMDLVQEHIKTDAGAHYGFEMTENAVALADIQTNTVGLAPISGELLLSGEISSNEKTDAVQTTLFDGRLDKLEVNYVGEYVRKGQRIGTMYSPEMYLAQDQLLTSSSYKDSHEKLYAAARNTSGLWKLTDQQIDDLLKSGKPMVNFPLVADVSGTVVEVLASEGTYFKQGDPLFKVSNLYTVWALFQAYEHQLPFLKKGQEITIKADASAGEAIKVKIAFIEPILDGNKRVVSVRADIENKDGLWKPGMFVKGKVSIGDEEMKGITIPKSAVLWTGDTSIVYTKPNPEKPIFEMTQVQLGQSMGESYIVLEGLEIGDEIVTNGTFTIDAAAQLSGKRSMMYSKKNKEHYNPLAKEKLVQIAPALNEQLKALLTVYFKMKDAMVSANENDLNTSSKELHDVLMSIEGNSLNTAVQVPIGEAKSAVVSIQNADNLEEKRVKFKQLSNHFLNFANQTSGFAKPIYVQHCPMADNQKGADWLSLEKAIRNPYFGDKMLTCGSVVNVIE